jgi:hypothetical protein
VVSRDGARFSTQRIASTLRGRRSSDVLFGSGPPVPASCLSFCLIHLRPGPFANVRPVRFGQVTDGGGLW